LYFVSIYSQTHHQHTDDDFTDDGEFELHDVTYISYFYMND